MAQKVIVKTAFPKLSDSEVLAIAGAVIKGVRTHARVPSTPSTYVLWAAALVGPAAENSVLRATSRHYWRYKCRLCSAALDVVVSCQRFAL